MPLDDLSLNIAVDTHCLFVVLHNIGHRSVRVWTRDCSWGWGTLFIHVSELLGEAPRHCLSPKPAIWTRNFPRFAEIDPGERHFFEVSPGNPEWDGLEDIAHLLDKPFYVQATLRIPETPEAIEHDVAVGEITSAPELSRPPHGWLKR